MTILSWLGLFIILLVLGARQISKKMYDLKLHPHDKTPEKFNIPFTELRFPTRNDRSLYGWWIPAAEKPETAPTLVLVHGWSRNLGRMLRYIQNLHPLGYNLLAFDARHHGSSDPDDHASMYKFGQDVQAAVQHIKTFDIDTERIGVVGLSIGGAGSIYAASIEPSIKAVVTVGAPAHPVDVMRRQFKQHHIPGFLINLVLKQIEWTIGAKYEDFAPVNVIAKSDASFFIIHGSEDEVVVPSQGDKLSQAARDGQASYWKILGRGHSNCHHEPEFWVKIDQFFTSVFGKEN
jgi:pimeloyl-ACP methyl ester carboxylesterase